MMLATSQGDMIAIFKLPSWHPTTKVVGESWIHLMTIDSLNKHGDSFNNYSKNGQKIGHDSLSDTPPLA